MNKIKSIKGFKNYLITTSGKVFRKHRVIHQFNGGVWDLKHKEMSQRVISGYFHVSLRANGKRFTKKVHRILAETFIKNPMKKEQVNHIDGNKLNNDISNLEWVTAKENSAHSFKIGTSVGQKGEKHSQANITENKAISIINLLNSGLSIRQVSVKMKVRYSTINHIRSKSTWRHLSHLMEF